MSPCGGCVCASRSTLPSPTHRHLFFLPLSAISRPACGAKNVLPRTSFPARRTLTSHKSLLCMSYPAGQLRAEGFTSKNKLPSRTHTYLSRRACGRLRLRSSYPLRVHALWPRSLAPVGAPPSHRREGRRGRAHRLSATCVQKCLHGAGERLSAGASMVAL